MLRRAFGLPGMSGGNGLLQYATKKELKFWTASADTHGPNEATLVPVPRRRCGLMSIADDAQRSGNTACFCHQRERSWTGGSPALRRARSIMDEALAMEIERCAS